MSRIAATFEKLQAARRTALIPYITVGHPSLAATRAIASALIEAGADLLELGVPFSDPLADGPIIQRAMHAALLNGTTPRASLAVAADVCASHRGTPILFMGYYNPIVRFGVEAYARACADAGVDGLIVPDLPVEESDELKEACRKYDVDLIFLLAPTSDDERIAAVTKQASGFIYGVSVVGITGARQSLSNEAQALVQRIRRHTDLPIAIGFGIGRAEQVRQVAQFADGAVVGSALVDAIANAPQGQEAERAGEFLRGLRE